MFEFSIIRKYLIPRRKHLSVSLIGFLSVFVIALVVWLLLVFLSVTEGMEKGWLDKLTSLNAPLRINPTKAYYDSYYHKIDTISWTSNYTEKSIGEKQIATRTDPYEPNSDFEVPADWPKSENKDLVKEVFAILEKKQGLISQPYELGGAMMRLQVVKDRAASYLTQASYLASYEEKNPYVEKLLLPPTMGDIEHLMQLARQKTSGSCLDEPLTYQNRIQPLISTIKAGITQAPAELFLSEETGVWLAKSFQDAGVRMGDQGYLAYSAATASSLQEQRIPIYVKGFYDPGIMSIGNKCILVPQEITRTINQSSSSYNFDPTLAQGIMVWFKDIESADKVKEELLLSFQKAGLAPYWTITTYKEYDFAKDLLQQFQSDKTLFTLVGVLIILVACSNIISLLIILVNDKKQEIGILQALGTSKKSIGFIFSGCGLIMGMLGSLIGIAAALLTLHNIDGITNLLSAIQGHEAFNPTFWGDSLPNALSKHALLFVLISTPIISLLAALVPAMKACKIHTSSILRS